MHLIRAHRSTLPRLMFTEPLNPREVQILRRVVSTQRQPDGPMVLGETVDYTARIIADAGEMPLPIVDELDMTTETRRDEPFLRFRDQLANMGVLVDRHPDVAETQLGPDEDANDPEPFDIQLKAAELPATRSAWLSAIAQADTGALINIWYQSVLGPDGGPSRIRDPGRSPPRPDRGPRRPPAHRPAGGNRSDESVRNRSRCPARRP